MPRLRTPGVAGEDYRAACDLSSECGAHRIGRATCGGIRPADGVRLAPPHSGERRSLAPISVPKSHRGIWPGGTVVNQYGPTECTMTSSYYQVVTPPAERAVVPIGRTIPQAPGIYPRWAAQSGAARRAGRAIHWWWWAGTRLSQPSGADRRAVFARPLQPPYRGDGCIRQGTSPVPAGGEH